jgi:FkbM family methyltransferase
MVCVIILRSYLYQKSTGRARKSIGLDRLKTNVHIYFYDILTNYQPMKNVIKQIIPKAMRPKLKAGYKKSLRQSGRALSCVINCLPALAKIECRSSINTHKAMDYIKHKILINASSWLENEGRAIPFAKEPETVAWIEGYFKKGEVFWDIGACVGSFSLIAAKYHEGQVAVYAFEPSFLNFSQLCGNILLNQCQGVISPFNIALSNKTEVANFNYRDLVPGGACNAFGEAKSYGDNGFAPALSQKVMGYRIDDLLETFKLPPPHHIKLDVDGIELKILSGAVKTLRHVKSILVEIDEDQYPQTSQFILNLGFKLDLKELRPSRVANCIFSRPR